jgi:primosomal protein N' (replication factor Y)
VQDLERSAANDRNPLRARVIIAAGSGAVEQLTYAVPPTLAGRLCAGHRVLVPMRTRRVTGIVLEVGVGLATGGARVRPIVEMLEARPLFDGPHLALIEFLASYYMASLGEAYRSVMPSSARVESRRLFYAGGFPSPLAAAAFTPLESAIVAALNRRPQTLRELRKLAPGEPAKMVDVALSRLLGEGLAASREATRGRHRRGLSTIARLVGPSGDSPPPVRLTHFRGPLQGAIIQRLARAGSGGLSPERLVAELPGARFALRRLQKSGVVEIVERNGAITPTHDSTRDFAAPPPFTPSAEQAAAVGAVALAIRERRFETFLLWGVTGSGKTAVYVELTAEALKAGRQVIVLVPEIALADQVVCAFRERFGSLAAVVHSAQSVAERWAGWMAALGGETRVIIGPRSAIFVPLHDAGLVVVDEEHDAAYKQDDGIRYNARDLAVMLGRLSRCPVVLGTATPAAESYENARRGRYRLLRLSERVAGRALPAVEILDLRERLPAREAAAEQRNNEEAGTPVPLAPQLIYALRANLAARGQSVIFLNRRGYHNFLQCHLCGNVIACANCSVSLTFHLRDRTLRCHYCGASETAPEKCRECGGPGLEGQGFGTERLVQTLGGLLPEARIARMDSDASARRAARAEIIDGLRRGTIDIVVGTQMITKGFDFPGVTLVGVVLADMTLNLPDFRSAERTFQLLTQVAGRAGRGVRPGHVLIQTYAPYHYSIRGARDQDYARFIRRELELRRELGYPPFVRMALVRIEGQEAPAVCNVATRVATLLAGQARVAAMRVLGPAPAPIERIRGRFRWQVVIKGPRLPDLRAALVAMRSQLAARPEHVHVRVAIDIDPVNMM